jgi:hypothetical protein
MNTTPTSTEPDMIYPDSDGMPMADNTLQYEWPRMFVSFGRHHEEV